jgi:hypothetical protein
MAAASLQALASEPSERASAAAAFLQSLTEKIAPGFSEVFAELQACAAHSERVSSEMQVPCRLAACSAPLLQPAESAAACRGMVLYCDGFLCCSVVLCRAQYAVSCDAAGMIRASRHVATCALYCNMLCCDPAGGSKLTTGTIGVLRRSMLC